MSKENNQSSYNIQGEEELIMEGNPQKCSSLFKIILISKTTFKTTTMDLIKVM